MPSAQSPDVNSVAARFSLLSSVCADLLAFKDTTYLTLATKVLTKHYLDDLVRPER